ncbi:hypothetical protein TNCV_1496111 [Trichonephila clavipes]|nr:hypothetical protein TNCV_1496111 [Trichonephila clavipes]
MVLWRSRLIIWKLQISLVSVIEVQDMNDLEHASATCSPPVGATGWPSSRIVEGLQWMASFKDWRELMCFRFFS